MREEARFLRMRFWWPKEVARGRGGLWAINFVVKRGMVERKFWETAWEKVELAGLPKARWRQATKVASAKLRKRGRD